MNPLPGVQFSPTEGFANPISKSPPAVVVILGLLMLVVCVPASSPIGENTSIGEAIFEPFTTMIEITRDCAADKFIVTVWPAPTVGFRAYHTCVRRSNPVVVLVGPASDIQLFPKLSEGVKVTPLCDDAQMTMASPPVLSKVAVVCVLSATELM